VKRASDTIIRHQSSLAALYETSQSIRSTLSTDVILSLLVEHAIQLVRSDSGILFLYDPERSRFKVAAITNCQISGDIDRYLELGSDTITGRVTQTGKSLSVRGRFHCTGAPSDNPSMPVRSLMSVPLLMRDTTMGVLTICSVSLSRAFNAEELSLVEQLAGAASMAIEQARLLEESLHRSEELETSYQNTLQTLAVALDLRDHETEGHSLRVSEMTVDLGERLGFSSERLETLRQGAFLHDVGKIGISDTILLKPGPLTAEEWGEMRRHPLLGYQLLSSVPFLKEASQLVLHHHERFDGSGYPYGLAGEAIPLEARMFAVVDAYDALTSDRPYRSARPHSEALEELQRSTGSYFDPSVVAAFLDMVASTAVT
jgi:hypothetical protein